MLPPTLVRYWLLGIMLTHVQDEGAAFNHYISGIGTS